CLAIAAGSESVRPLSWSINLGSIKEGRCFGMGAIHTPAWAAWATDGDRRRDGAFGPSASGHQCTCTQSGPMVVRIGPWFVVVVASLLGGHRGRSRFPAWAISN